MKKRLKFETLQLATKRIEISELDPFKLNVKFVICDFNPNKNNVQLNRDTIENWMSSLLTQPLVGKVSMDENGKLDFTSHNVKKVKYKDSKGKEQEKIVFDTSAFGTFTSVKIEENEDGVEEIVAEATVWRRFETASDVLLSRVEQGTLYSSWEMVVSDYVYKVINGKPIKVINDGEFIGHAVLGESISPAYDSSHVLQVANEEIQANDLYELVKEDIIMSEMKDGEQENMKKTENGIEEVVVSTDIEVENSNEEVIEDEEIVESNEDVETSMLTSYELQDKIQKSISIKLDTRYAWITHFFPVEKIVLVRVDDKRTDNWNEYIKFTYEVDENDNITVSEPEDVKLAFSTLEINDKQVEFDNKLSVSNEALIKANEQIKSLESEIAELSTYKEKFEQAEQVKIEQEREVKRAELSAFALKSELITSEELESDDTIKTLISNVDEDGIKTVIAERFIAKINEKTEPVEVSEVKEQVKEQVNESVSRNLESVLGDSQTKFSMSTYLKK